MIESAAYSGRVKYSPMAAAKYQVRKRSKHRAEIKLVRRAVAAVPRGTILDVPCGGGRVAKLLAESGFQVTAADLSPAMLSIAAENLGKLRNVHAVEHRDIEALDYPAQSFDAIISFRLFHHFPAPEIRARAVGELCRVAKRHVLLSYFSPLSFTALKRGIQERWLGRARQKYHTPLSEVRGYFEQNGFRLVKNYARIPLIHTLHLAVFERNA
jgi:ubiquinone/menaquinone biosynthesis C-methylase UbiE